MHPCNCASQVNDPGPAYAELRQLTEPKAVRDRSHAGFNPERHYDVQLFKAVRDADYIVRGFRNADIREPLSGAIQEVEEKRRASAAVGRMLKRLHVCHLDARIPYTRR